MIDWKKNSLLYAEILAMAWKDESYRRALLKDPKAFLTEQGMQFPKDMIVTVAPGTMETVMGMKPTLTLPLPPQPTSTDKSLGKTYISSFHCCCVEDDG